MVEWHKHSAAVKATPADNPGLQRIYAAVERLTHSPNRVVRTEAENTRLTLRKA